MKFLLAVLLAVSPLTPPPFETLPDPTDPANCPEPPKTISTVAGRIYECHSEEEQYPYRDVTPPDDKAHWILPFGSDAPAPSGTGTVHPADDWPFRGILVEGDPARGPRVYAYVFDNKGVILDSNIPSAIGDQMMEVRISGIRMWPSARVFYRVKSAAKNPSVLDIVGTWPLAAYALVVDGSTLCPALDGADYSAWDGGTASPSPAHTHISGRCGEAGASPMSGPDGVSYRYPELEPTSSFPLWSFQRHSDPIEPLLYRGKCLVLCDAVSPDGH